MTCLFEYSTCFKQLCSHPQEDNWINPLNTELNPICHLLVLSRDLTFMDPCIVSIFRYISNKMQRYTVYLYLETALHVLGGTSPIIRSAINCIYSIWHLSHRYCYLPLSVGTVLSVLWVAYTTHSTHKPVPTLPPSADYDSGPKVNLFHGNFLIIFAIALFTCTCLLNFSKKRYLQWA
jgi:hypothetical protein